MLTQILHAGHAAWVTSHVHADARDNGGARFVDGAKCSRPQSLLLLFALFTIGNAYFSCVC